MSLQDIQNQVDEINNHLIEFESYVVELGMLTSQSKKKAKLKDITKVTMTTL